MGQHIDAGRAGQSLGLAHHVVGVHDGHVGKELVVSQRVLHAGLLVGDHGEGGHLGTGTGGGGDGYEVGLLSHLREGVHTLPDIHEAHGHILEVHLRVLVHHPHDLSSVHGGTAAQGDDHVRLEGVHGLCAGLCVCQGGIRLYVGEGGVYDSQLIQLVGDGLGVSIHI